MGFSDLQNIDFRNQCPSRMRKEEVPEPMTTEEIASRLVTELANEEPEGSVLRSTKGLTVQTGTYVRPYVKKRGRRGDDDNDDENYSVGKKVKTTKLWICPHCPDYVFERKRDQINHIRSVHGVIKRHVCDQCGKSLEVTSNTKKSYSIIFIKLLASKNQYFKNWAFIYFALNCVA